MGKNLALMLLISFIFSCSLSCAADITIGRYKYPSIILIPIISIVICSVILAAILFNIARKRMTVKKPIFRFGRPAKEKRQENIYLKDIKKFRKELAGMQGEQAFDMLSDITKNFFKELLDLHYEFTYDELEKELRKRNKRNELIDICHNLSEMRYSGKKIIKEDIESIAERIQELIKKEEVRSEEKELGVSRALMKEKRGFLSKVSELQSEQGRKRHLLELMSQEEGALKKDMEIAKNIYHKILSSYYRLPAKDRKDVYEKLTNFYEQVNKMLFSSFYSKQSKKQLSYFTKQLSELQKEAEKVIAAERIREAGEKHAEKIKVPEIRKFVKGLEAGKERAIKIEELKKLERVEKEAIDRIRNIGEGIVEQGMLQLPEKSEEKQIIREIKYALPQEHVLRKPEKPVHAEHLTELPRAGHERHLVQETKHAEPRKMHIERHVQDAEPKEKEKHAEKPAETGIKSRKIMHIAREQQAIMEKLERLRKGYIG